VNSEVNRGEDHQDRVRKGEEDEKTSRSVTPIDQTILRERLLIIVPPSRPTKATSSAPNTSM
jgi:hypothetical protein